MRVYRRNISFDGHTKSHLFRSVNPICVTFETILATFHGRNEIRQKIGFSVTVTLNPVFKERTQFVLHFYEGTALVRTFFSCVVAASNNLGEASSLLLLHPASSLQPGERGASFLAMSNVLLTRIWDKTKFKGDTLLVLLCLADHSSDEGYCWPSYETLARRTRCSRRHIIRIVKNLIAEGWIRTERRTNNLGQTSNLFILLIPDRQKEVSDICDIKKEVGDIQTTKQGGVGDIQDTLGGSNVTLTIKEPSYEEPPIAANAAFNDENLTFPEIDMSQDTDLLSED